MARRPLPLVSDNHLIGLNGDQSAPIVVGSNAWYAWLTDQHIQSFSFRNPPATFTARLEHKRNGWYWYAYRKRAGRLLKAYLGKTEQLTLERLNAVAASLTNRTFTSSFASSKERRSVTALNLPAQLTPLIGREQEVALASALLQQPEIRLLTLTGTGGVGKTRLGLHIATDLAKDFDHGVCFVSLSPISNPNLVIPTIAQAFGLREAIDQPIVESLTHFLREKSLLLFLDNFEQVIGAAPALTALLGRCLSLKILVTSRQVLRVRGEQEFAVQPLAFPNPSNLSEPEVVSQYAAVALFLQRVRSVNPDFRITTANARTIAAICTHLDGLPLAIELAAARLKLLSPQALLARLEHRLAVLTRGAQDAPTRQQTIRNTLQWSYDLLDAQEQRLFRRLSVFVGGCTLEAVEAMCARLEPDTTPDFQRVMVSELDGVASLIDKSLLHPSQQEGDEPRLTMLETVREYGMECLTASKELEVTRQSHALYYLMLAEEAAPHIFGAEPARWSAHLEREHDNLRVAQRWLLEQGEAGRGMELALRLGVALMGFWIIYGFFSEGRTFLERALAGSMGVPLAVQATAREAATFMALNQGDFDWAKTLSEDSLALSRECGDTAGIAKSLTQLEFVAHMQSDLDTAYSLGEEVVSFAKEMGDKSGIADALHNLAFVLLEQGEYARAYAMYEECLEVFMEVGNKVAVATTLHQLALALYLSLGDQERVCSLLEESLVLWREIGSKNGIAVWAYLAGRVALSQGDAAQAGTLLRESVAHYKDVGDRWHTARSLSGLAKVEAVQGNYAAARTLYEENLALCREMGDKNIAPALEGLASVALGLEQPAWAARLWGASEGLRKAINAPLPPVEHSGHEQAVAAARTLLGEQAFATAWAEGRMMLPEQALVTQGPVTMPTLVSAGQSSTRLVTSSATSPARLTKREVEVLRLLTMGLTNNQIAEQLVISLPTVNTHVGSIYARLGVSSRAAATRYAVEHHLV